MLRALRLPAVRMTLPCFGAVLLSAVVLALGASVAPSRAVAASLPATGLSVPAAQPVAKREAGRKKSAPAKSAPARGAACAAAARREKARKACAPKKRKPSATKPSVAAKPGAAPSVAPSSAPAPVFVGPPPTDALVVEPVEPTTPSEQVAPVEEPRLPVEEPKPPIELKAPIESTPPVEEPVQPPVEEAKPPVEEPAPPVEESKPPVEESTPPPVEEPAPAPPVEELTPPIEPIPPVEESKPSAEEKAQEEKAKEVKASEEKAREEKAREVKAAEERATEAKIAEEKAAEEKAQEVKTQEVKAAEEKAKEVKAEEEEAKEVKALEEKAREVKAKEEKLEEEAKVAELAAPFRFFSPTSFWNEELSANAPLDPSSAGVVTAFDQEIAAAEAAKKGLPNINTTAWSVPVYTVPADQPTVRVRLTASKVYVSPALQSAWEAVPLPAGAQPAVGTDKVLVVWQPSTDKLWEFWQLEETPTGWQATWGGAMQHASADSGAYGPEDWAGAKSNWGAAATSLSMAGGLITLEDLEKGQINHALAMSIPTTRGGVYAAPAERTDGWSTEPLSLPEGAHLRLEPGLNLAALHLPKVTLMIAEAAQRYGIVVVNQSANVAIYGQDPIPTGANPYTGPHGYYEGKSAQQILEAFPWSHLQLLKMELHSTS